jgi:uncharacterized NAD(P)/FAD-binding protein YdhS
MENITFIGSGPSNIFAIIHLLSNGYKGKNITLIDRGKNPYKRQSKEYRYSSKQFTERI